MTKKQVARAGSLLLILFSIASGVFFTLSPLVLAARPAAYGFNGGMTILAPTTQSAHQVNVQVEAESIYSSHPIIDYIVDVCGTGSFTGYFILTGDARLIAGTEQLLGASLVPGDWSLENPASAVQDELTNRGAEAFKISMPTMVPCVGSSSAIGSGGASLGGVAFVISGQLSRPIEFSGSVMGLTGPKKTMVWPLLGAFDQLSANGDLGEYDASGTISGSLSRPPVFTVQVRGAFPEQDEVISTRPTATSDGTWDQYAAYTPSAALTDDDTATEWQDIGAVSGVCFGIGAGVLATILLDWVRKWNKSDASTQNSRNESEPRPATADDDAAQGQPPPPQLNESDEGRVAEGDAASVKRSDVTAHGSTALTTAGMIIVGAYIGWRLWKR